MYFESFCQKVGVTYFKGMISAHGDKCDNYRSRWDAHGIPFAYGVAIYLLSYLKPFEDEVRETKTGFVPPVDWVISKYETFKDILRSL